MKIAEAVTSMEAWAKPSYAVEGDRIGLQVGNSETELSGIIVTLDVTMEVVKEAINAGANLIIAHHPFIFSPIKTVDTSTYRGKLLVELLQHNIAVYVAHTNLDIAPGGVNDMLANALDLKQTRVLAETSTEKLHKLIIFVPETHTEDVHTAMAAAGGGALGNYSACAFQTSGVGMFKPNEEATPYLGSAGELEKVSEVRLEMIVHEPVLQKVLSAAKKAHPYEVMAYDSITLDVTGETYGLGRIGMLEKPLPFGQFAEHVKRSLQVPFVRTVGDHERLVQTIAVLGGDGNKYIGAAQVQGADVYVTGDLYFHTAQDAMYEGMLLVDPGHHAEKIMKHGVAHYLKQQLPSIAIAASEHTSEPFNLL
ncbi:Nif3-like dinuclear metal center hexameric protein [Aureibacillus halotolerans]|uniref:GTP cyclohydrolase 1 type 2 homolog n=1 Tax=Aureibacillus halotolerans TaxID=1508390 RepID=A0A4R6U5G7_9BACI|nr:Nif3-like dinuclear metal center hexameric protein [Aureibacillus halotolerans]TDQ41720.1 dinuclear metal center YbgI/SA1388 family protein [Aureibacillus halotolerans]